jgi:MraZ protein
LFYGEYEHSLDPKGRFIVPAKFREAMKKRNYPERFYITRGLDKCLFVFPEEEWRSQEDKFKSLAITNPDARDFNRLYFSGASEVDWDPQGRVLLPRNLKEYAEIGKDVVLIGVSSRIEIWGKERWKAFYAIKRDSFESIARGLIP